MGDVSSSRDAIARKLVGANGELPVARVTIQKSNKDPTVQWMILSAFTSQVINELDENDLILDSRIDMETRDGVKIWDMVAIPGEFATKLRAMESTKQNIGSRMSDWIDYLDTMYELNRRDEWGAKIVDIKLPTTDDPFYVYALVAPSAVLNKVKNKRKTEVEHYTQYQIAIQSAKHLDAKRRISRTWFYQSR